MKQVYLLKSYQSYPSGAIISVSNNVAFGLIDDGTAREVYTRDFLVKPEFGVSKTLNTRRLSKKLIYKRG